MKKFLEFETLHLDWDWLSVGVNYTLFYDIHCFYRLTLSYCCASDKYFRGSRKETFLEGWKSGAAEVISVFRKYEYDWTAVSVVCM